MNIELTLQQFTALPENVQFQIGEYVEFLFNKYSGKLNTEKEKSNDEKEELSPELKTFLENRLADYRKNPEKVMTWQVMEERLQITHDTDNEYYSNKFRKLLKNLRAKNNDISLEEITDEVEIVRNERFERMK